MTPSLYLSKDCAVVTVGSVVLTSSVTCNALQTIDLSVNRQHTSVDDIKQEEHNKLTDITCASVSNCGKLFTACTSDKRLFLWQTEQWTLLSVRSLNRAASSVKFTPSAQGIVVADKTGDAYLYSVERNTESGQLLLGHLSMLLDVVISPCENFIITCDRDEKIRVSRFPNAYNIHSYCLGHEEFVSRIEFLPSDKKVLVSCSGDGSVRFWNYLEGKQLGIIKCDNDVSKLKDRNNDETGDCTIVPEKTAVTRFSTSAATDGVSLLAVGVASFLGCILYRISGDSSAVFSSLLYILNLEIEPWDILLTENQELWCLASVENHPVSVYVCSDTTLTLLSNKDSVHCRSNSLLSSFNSKWILFRDIPVPQVERVMHKRRFDDLQEYKQRKLQRVANKSISDPIL